MAKVFIVLTDHELLEVERICLDKDPQEALAFVQRVIEPKLRKRVPCMDKSHDMQPRAD